MENETLTQKEPYVLSYKNTSEKTVNGILFGFNDYKSTTNFGNSKDVSINRIDSIPEKKFDGSFVATKFEVSSETPENLKQDFFVVHIDNEGKETKLTIGKNKKIEANRVVFDERITITTNSYITFNIEPKSEILIKIYI